MLYENKNIICLLKGQERPCNWLSKESSAIPTSKEIGMYQHSDTNPIKRMFFFPLINQNYSTTPERNKQAAHIISHLSA